MHSSRLAKILGLFILAIFVVFTYSIFSKNQNQPSISPSPTTNPQAFPYFDHIVVIVMENKSYDEIVGNSRAPYINSLIKSGGVASNYYAITHPSLPNYLALTGADTFGITSDCTDCFVNATNLVDNLEKAGKSWRVYMESMPGNCFVGNSGLYAQKHNPFIYFDDIRSDKNRCQNIVPYSDLSQDLNAEVSDFIWISPNLCDDMHECFIQEGDKWLSENLPQLIESLSNSDYLIILTWDESDMIEKNQVATIFSGPKVKKNYSSAIYYNHYSLLSLIEKSWNLPSLTLNDKNANPMVDFFQ